MSFLPVALIIAGTTVWAEEAPPKGEHHGPLKFEEMDANNDGSVSLPEFTEAQQKQIERRFHFLDSNNDGKLSQGEMESGRERMKKRWDDHKDGDKPDAPK